MTDPIYTEQYKNCTIKIIPDTDCQSPDDWGNDDFFLVAFHRQFAVERKGFSQDMCANIVHGGKYEDDSDNYEAQEIMAKYHIFLLEAYIHSGVVLALSKEGKFPDRQWDVSSVGMIFVSRKEWKTRAKAKARALSLIQEWNDVLSGNVYGFMAETKDGEDIASCYGFYGDYEKSGILEEAKAEIDTYIEAKRLKHEAKLKVQIKHHVPLERRAAL